MKAKRQVVTEMYPKPADFVRSLSRTSDLYDRVKTEKRTLTDLLEDMPGLSSEEYNDGMDAFERLLYVAGIRVAPDETAGLQASSAGVFIDTESGKMLLPEFVGRNIRKVRLSQSRAPYASSDVIPGSAERPYADNLTPRTDLQIAPAIPLSAVVSQTTLISGQDYRSTYIKNDTANQRLVRVGEGAPLPKAKLVTAPNVVNMYKFGRALEITYEQMRRLRVDRLGIHVQKIAVQTEVDQVIAALDTIVNGDGNTDTAAAVTTQSSLDGAAVDNKLHFAAWQAFIKLFKSPYVLTTALMQSVVATMLETLNVGSANLLMVSLMQQSPSVAPIRAINQTATGINYGWIDEAPALKVVAWDKRYALERVVEIGSEIQEVMRYINTQTEEMTISMNEGYAVIDPQAAQILNIGA